MGVIFDNVFNLELQQVVMWVIGGVLIYLAIKKDMEPTLLLPIGFGTILVNLPLSGAVTQVIDGVKEIGIIDVLFDAGISNELFPCSVALIGFLMFGNLIRECGVLDSLSDTAQKVLANLITIFLGITISTKMQAEFFLTKETLLILGLGLIAFIFDTIGGVLFAKIINLFSKNKINPMVGAAGISAFPMSARVIHKMGLEEDPHNFLLMHAVGANVAGQIGSVIAGGLIINLVGSLL